MKWISVKDRLPELPNWVIVCDANGDVYPGLYQDGTWYDDVCERAMHIMSYWTPLPEPPEVDRMNGKTLNVILKAVRSAKKPIYANANLYRIYGDADFKSWDDQLKELEAAEKYIMQMMEANDGI